MIEHNQLNKNKIVPGLFAIGECANVSVHGANRLGANSLLDLVVLGRACGRYILDNFKNFDSPSPSQDDIEQAFSRCFKLKSTKKGEHYTSFSKDMKKIMQADFGVFREESSMLTGLKKISDIRDAAYHIAIKDRSNVFNTDLLGALEFQNLTEVAFATAVGAKTRQESRGAHSRVDYPKRDDKKWQKHIVVDRSGNTEYRDVNMQPVHVDPIKVQEREH